MGKNKKNNSKDSEKQADKAGKHPSDRRLQREGKAKPAEADHLQHIPFRLREILKSKERMKPGPRKGKKVKHALSAGVSHDNEIPVLRFRRGKKESEKAYMRRMENETQHVLFLTKNQVDRKPELEADEQEKCANKGKSEKKKEYNALKLQKLQQKRLNHKEARMEKEMFVDQVPFGEVAMAPPSLSTKPRKAQVKSQMESRKLLLTSLLGQTVTSTNKPSMARQRMMEEERERAVQAYRHLKKQKQQQQEARMAAVGKLKNIQ